MKGFFFFVVINVFVWNTVVCAGEDKLETANNIFELNMMVGEYKFLNQYKGKMLIISNLFTNMEFNAHNIMLMELSMKYHKIGLRVIAIFSNQLNNTDTEEEPERKMIDSIKKNNIEFMFDDEEMSFWNFLKYLYNCNIETNSRKKDVYHTFFVDGCGIVFKGFIQNENVNEKISEFILLWNWKPWNNTKSVYDIMVKNYNNDFESMEKYRNKVLIVSFICELSDEEDVEKFRSLLCIAKNYKTDNLEILIFLRFSTMDVLKIHTNLISKSYLEPKVHVYQHNNTDSKFFLRFCQLKIEEIDGSVNTENINAFIIDQEGKVIGEFNDDMKEINEMLKRHVVKDEHDVNMDQIVS